MKKIGVLLCGCGVYDGSEIQEAVLTLLAIDEHNAEAVCFAPNINQHHVLNHTTGEEMNETRNVLVESARIARGNIKSLSDITVNDFDAMVIPGGFGDAKNLTKWAFSGAKGEILPEVKAIINDCMKAGKPVVGLCMGPTVIAKALEGSGIEASLTAGTTEEKSPYDIQEVTNEMASLGAKVEMKNIKEITIDSKHKIISAPCYMMEASIKEIRQNVNQAFDALFEML